MRRHIVVGLIAVTSVTLSAVIGTGPSQAQAAKPLRMYVLDCGRIETRDISRWSPGVNVGKPFTLSDNCYLIRHGKDWMLWDSGYPDSLAATPEGIVGPRSRDQHRREWSHDTRTLRVCQAPPRVVRTP